MDTLPQVETAFMVQSKSPEVMVRSPETVDRYKITAEKMVK